MGAPKTNIKKSASPILQDKKKHTHIKIATISTNSKAHAHKTAKRAKNAAKASSNVEEGKAKVFTYAQYT